jgi:hypothetical protein
MSTISHDIKNRDSNRDNKHNLKRGLYMIFFFKEKYDNDLRRVKDN